MTRFLIPALFIFVMALLFAANNSPLSAIANLESTTMASEGPVNDETSLTAIEDVDLWPTNGWTTATPAEMEMDAAKLQEARDYALSIGGSGMITRGGKLVMSWGNVDQLYDIKSATKQFGATALGIAIRDGVVDLDDLAQDHLPGVGIPPASNGNTGWLDGLTIKHLATHTAGFDKSGGYTDQLFEPGTAWAYSDGGANWLADVLTVAIGKDLKSVMFDEVFVPLGITVSDLTWRENGYRERTINGITRREFGAGISIDADSMARIGYLYLRKGQWDNQQILPESFVEMATTPVPDIRGLPVVNDPEGTFPGTPDRFGLLWYTNADGRMNGVPTDMYMAWGMGNQHIVVIPSLDIVASRVGPSENAWPGTPITYDVVEPFVRPMVESVVYHPDRVLSSIDVSPASANLSQGETQQFTATPLDQFGDPFINEVGASTLPAGDLLAGYWKMDEGSGTTAEDSSGNGLNGVLLNGPAWVDGQSGTALKFDGIDDYVDTGFTTDLSEWTFGVWVKSPQSPSSGLASGPVHREKNFAISWNHPAANFRGAAALKTGGTWHSASFGPLSANEWHHLAATYDGEMLRAYTDGILVSENNSPSGPPDSESSSLVFGKHSIGPFFFEGEVDEVTLFSTALGSQGIGSLAGIAPASSQSSSTSAAAESDSPATPAGVRAIPGFRQIMLDWNDNEEADLSHYDVYRSASSGGPYDEPFVSILAPTSFYVDSDLDDGQTYYYVVAAVDLEGNSSPIAVQPNWSATGGSIDSTGLYTAGSSGSYTITASAGEISGQASVTVVDPNTPPAGPIHFATGTDTTIGGISVRKQDIVEFDGSAFSIYFDGSDVGLSNLTIDSLSLMGGSEILLSFAESGVVAGIGPVDPEDIVKFKATSLGSTTSGTFEMYFDGSAAGLAANQISAIDLP